MPTIREMAKWTGISYQALSKFITGTGGMSVTRLMDLSDKTGILVDELLRLRGGEYRGIKLRMRLIDAYRAAKDRDQTVG